MEKIDAFTLSARLQNQSQNMAQSEKYTVQSVSDEMALYQAVARSSLEEYLDLAKTVTTFAFKRDLIRTLGKVELDCQKPSTSLAQLSSSVYQSLESLTQNYITDGEIRTVGQDLDSILAEIQSRRNENGTSGLLSAFPSLNKYFTYEPGEMVTLQAKYKNGKSVFLMNEAVHMLENGVPVLVIDTEMQTRLYTERLLSHKSGVPVNKIKNGDMTDKEQQALDKAVAWLKPQPFIHRYAPDMTLEELYSLCRVLKNKMGLGFVVYDYVKSNATSTSDNYNLLGQKCDFLKNRIAGELNLPVLTACQLNRQGEVADSDKINRYSSVGIKWSIKGDAQKMRDGGDCGNALARVTVNRLGEQMDDNSMDYIDFWFMGSTMTITEAKQHEKPDVF